MVERITSLYLINSGGEDEIRGVYSHRTLVTLPHKELQALISRMKSIEPRQEKTLSVSQT